MNAKTSALSPQRAANFNRVARVYRWAEYLSLGPLLTLTRNTHLARVQHCRQALALGDGDGRFVAALLRRAPAMSCLALDSSSAMLRLLRRRCRFAGARLSTQQVDLRHALGLPIPPSTDLITSHFVLDCLTQAEANALIAHAAALVPAGGLWLTSDFGLPSAKLVRPLASAYIRVLYSAFRLLTGLQVQRLPDHRAPLRRAGFELLASRSRLQGLLFSELWRKGSLQRGEADATPSHTQTSTL